ncbi:DUF6350 family protein [Actinokineospora auranticolor]|uniref:Uncharacterized protein n=1 Tax=Actinokineospora auranticolor TaxID=155976 RepID=A0A2S6GWQ9_9PSEU|nr:DUF6350 family protein [Actinokineospora auranticolor]PPK69649.1 hypothetical protein CLV40_103259 [Actinokineospora auranticolor]
MSLVDTDLVEDDEEPVPVTAGLRVKVLAVAAVGPLLTGYAAVAAVLALVTATAARSSFTTGGVLASAVPGWLAAYQVPVRIEGHELGVLPLLSTVLVAVLVWRTAAGAAERLEVETPREAAQVVLSVVGAHAAVGLTLGLLCTGRVVVDPLAGLYYPALVAGLAAVVGVLPQSGVWSLVTARVDPLALRGLSAGLLAVVAMVATGAFVLTLSLVLSGGTVTRLFAAEGPGGGLGMLLLSAGYLPNAVIAAAGFAAGPGFALGPVVVSPVDFAGGAVPPLPLLGALPETAAPWWVLLFAFPGAVGTLVGWLLRECAEEPRDRLRAVAVAAVAAGMVFAVLAGCAGGALAGGPFDPLDLRAPWLSLALVAWIAAPGGVVAWLMGPRPLPEVELPEFEFDEPDELDEPDESALAEELDGADDVVDEDAGDVADSDEEPDDEGAEVESDEEPEEAGDVGEPEDEPGAEEPPGR